jgi:hypothetical protein
MTLAEKSANNSPPCSSLVLSMRGGFFKMNKKNVEILSIQNYTNMKDMLPQMMTKDG